jgi:Arc/MetJ-type ribon-helix-helix transcriptional regulator
VRVSPEIEAAVLQRVGSGVYRDADEVLTLAMQLMEWAENDPTGRRQLLRFANRSRDADSEAGLT